MASTERTIRVRFGGSARGLKAAAKDGEVSISAWQRQLDRVRGSLGRTTKASDEFGQGVEKASSKARTAAASLDRQIGTLRESLQGLAIQFAEGGDSGIAKQMRAAEREMRRLTKARGLIGGDDDDAVKTGAKFGARFAEGLASGLARAGGPITSALSGVFGSMPPQAQALIGAAVVGGIASVAPLVGGIIAGAVVGGVGIGGVAGGMAIAATHADVKAAAKSTGDVLKETMQRSAVAFVPATVDALGIVRAEIVSMEDDFRRIFSKAARYVEPLTRGVTGFLRNLLPGVEDAVDRAGPIIDELASWGPRLGTALTYMLSAFAQHAYEGGRALHMLMTIVTLGIRSITNMVVGLTIAYGWLEKLGAAATGNVPKLMALVAEEKRAKQAGDEHGVSVEQLTAALSGYGVQVEDAATKNERLRSSMEQLTGAAQSSRQATMDFQAGLDQLTESVKTNGTTLDVGSEKGRANLTVIENLISAADRAGTAAEQRALAEGQSAEAAAAAGARMRQTFIADLEHAAQAAGLSGQKIQDMVRELKIADGKRANMYVTTHYYADTSALDSLRDGVQRNGPARGLNYAGGGRIGGRGTTTSDSNPIWASRDEYMLNARASRAIGYDNLDRLNQLGGGQARSVLADRDYLAGGGGRGVGAGGATSGTSSGGGVPEVRVFIGDRELTDIVRVEVGESNRGLKRRVLAGAGAM